MQTSPGSQSVSGAAVFLTQPEIYRWKFDDHFGLWEKIPTPFRPNDWGITLSFKGRMDNDIRNVIFTSSDVNIIDGLMNSNPDNLVGTKFFYMGALQKRTSGKGHGYAVVYLTSIGIGAQIFSKQKCEVLQPTWRRKSYPRKNMYMPSQFYDPYDYHDLGCWDGGDG